MSQAEQQESARLWSVTTLIKAGLGTSDGLVGWAVRTTAEAAYDKPQILNGYREAGDRQGAVKWLADQRFQKSGSAAARGTSVHKLIEAYALGQTPKVPDEFRPWDEQIRRYLDEHKPVFEASEAPVYNMTLGYAGTMDSIQVVGGKRCIVDCKTTEWGPDAKTPGGYDKARPPFPEIALQLVAYARAEVVGVSPAQMRTFNRRRYYVYDPALTYEPMPALDGALALVVSPEDYQLVPVRVDDEVWRAFGHVRECARWQLDISRRVLGPQIAPQAVAA